MESTRQYASACIVTRGVAEQGHGPRDYLMPVREGGFAPLEAGGALSHCRVLSHMGIHTRTGDDAHGVVTCRAERAPALHPNGWLGRSCGPPPRPAYDSLGPT